MGKVAFDSADVVALADKIRERTNSSDTMKLRDMPSEVDEVFDKGKQQARDEAHSIVISPALDAQVFISGEGKPLYKEIAVGGSQHIYDEGYSKGEELGYSQGYDECRDSEYAIAEEMTYTPSLEEQVDEREFGNLLIKKVTINPATEVYNQGYNEGKESEYDTFWDTFQYNGDRTNYFCAFYGNKEGNYCWTPDNFRPKYDLNVTIGRQMFQEWQNNQYTWEYNDETKSNRIDLTKWFATLGIEFNTSDCTDFTQMFYLATRISRIPPLDIRKAEKLTNMFHQNTVLHTIDALIVDENTDFSGGGFSSGLPSLENIEIPNIDGKSGKIGKNFNISGSTKLSKDSIESVVNALSTTTSGLTLTLSQTAKENAFTDEQWAELIATRQNWTISLI